MNITTLNTLIAYHRWAQEKLYRKAMKIPERFLRDEAPLSHGNLLATLLHPVDTQWYWRSACEHGIAPPDRLSIDQYPTVAAIAERWEDEQVQLEGYVASLQDSDLIARFEYSWPGGRLRSHVVWHILVHIVTHGVHHRAEIGRHMETIAYSPGDLDFCIYCEKMGI